MFKPYLLQALKQRRTELGLTQADVESMTGIKRQQYNRLENSGNPNLKTLDLLAKALNAHLVLVPKDKLTQVEAILKGEEIEPPPFDPWAGLLEQDDD